MSVTLDVLGLRLPQPAWVVLDALRREGFTGEARLVGSPVTRVFTDRGRIYLAEIDGVAPLGARLVAAGVLTDSELARGAVRVGHDEHLGHLFDRAPSVDPAAVLVALEGITEATLQFVAGQILADVTLRPYAYHPSGVHLWADAPARPVLAAPPAPPAPLTTPPHGSPVASAPWPVAPPPGPAADPHAAPPAPVPTVAPGRDAPTDADPTVATSAPVDDPAAAAPPAAAPADVHEPTGAPVLNGTGGVSVDGAPDHDPAGSADAVASSFGPDLEPVEADAVDEPAETNEPVDSDPCTAGGVHEPDEPHASESVDPDPSPADAWAVSAPTVPDLPDDTFSVIWPDGDTASPPPFDPTPAEPEPLLTRLEPAEVPDDVAPLVARYHLDALDPDTTELLSSVEAAAALRRQVRAAKI